MLGYIIKRLLLMIPTLFAICLVVFIILNLAPGKPGGAQMQQEGAMGARETKTREAYKIFKEQFNLDRPVLFNMRFALTKGDIGDKVSKIANTDGGYKAAEIIDAQDRLEDWGSYAVPYLVTMLDETDDPRLLRIIVEYLSLDAKRPIIKPYATLSELSELEKEENRRIDRRNQYVAGLRFSEGASGDDRRRIVGLWKNWYSEHEDEYRYGSLEKMKIFFLDTRFAKYLSNLARLDFGISHVTKKPVLATILNKLKYSFTISFLAIFFSYLIALPIGIYSSVKQYSLGDRVATVMLFVLYSLPSFFVGTLLLNILSQGGLFPLFPTGGFASGGVDSMTTLEQLRDIAWHIVLPVACLTYGSLAALSRYARTGLLEVIRSDYIRTARAKGLPEKVVILRHALRNGMMPIITLLASILPILIGGSVVIEFIFNIPGVGLFVLDSIYNRDYNAIMAVQLLAAAMTLFGILLSDISYAIVDPRIKFN